MTHATNEAIAKAGVNVEVREISVPTWAFTDYGIVQLWTVNSAKLVSTTYQGVILYEGRRSINDDERTMVQAIIDEHPGFVTRTVDEALANVEAQAKGYNGNIFPNIVSNLAME